MAVLEFRSRGVALPSWGLWSIKNRFEDSRIVGLRVLGFGRSSQVSVCAISRNPHGIRLNFSRAACMALNPKLSATPKIQELFSNFRKPLMP